MSQRLDHSYLAQAPRALSTLEIPDAVPIPWDNEGSDLYGVGIAAINSGLKVFIEPYDNMALGDAVDVYWDGQSVPLATVDVDASNLNQRLGLTLPEVHFLSGDFQPFFRVRRISGATADSPGRNIRVKLDLPGGRDPDPSTPQNENLAAPKLEGDILQYGVDDAQAALGVEVTIIPYPNMAEYDRIDFSWGGERLIHTVLPDEVKKNVVIHVNEKTILDAGDGQIMLMYQVIDAVANRSDGWSPVTQLEVLAGGATLEAPFLADWEGNMIDLATLGSDDVDVEIFAISPSFTVGDTVTFFWAGKTATGAAVTWSDERAVTGLPSVIHVTVPNASVGAVAGGSAAIYYTLLKSNGERLSSRRTSVNVIGAALELPPPKVREASGDQLAADVSQATVDIAPYIGMAAGDLVSLVWSGLRADGLLIDHRDEMSISGSMVNQTVTFTVPGPQQVAELAGGDATVYYQVMGDNNVSQTSEPLYLRVGQQASTLPAPAVVEAPDGVLDADIAYATVAIAAYAGMAAGDRVDLEWSADVTGIYSDWLPVTNATVGHKLTLQVPAVQIADNHTASVSYSVLRAAGGTEASAALTLRIGEEQLLPAPTVDEVDGSTINADDHLEGVTVRIPAAANLAAGDLVTVYWDGETADGTTAEEGIVSGAGAGQALPIHIPFAMVQANSGGSVQVSYTVARTTGIEENSAVAVYDVSEGTSLPGNGTLQVMGARSQRKGTVNGPVSPVRTLSVLDAETGGLLEAVWQYDGDGASLTGPRFRDTQPDRLLHVRTEEDHVILNAGNINGNAYAMAARRNAGNMVAWGNSSNGGSVPSSIATLDDIIQVTGMHSAFAAVRENGHVVAWGNASYGGEVPAAIVTLDDIIQVTGAAYQEASGSFAALRSNGRVVTWGDANGSISDEIQSQLTDVRAIYCADNAFAALTADSRVVTWGRSGSGTGGDSSSVQSVLEGQISYEATAVTRGIGIRRG